MFSLRRWVGAAAYVASAIATTGAQAGAKDESAAEWLAPKWFNEWHDGLAAKGLNFGATYIGDNIGNVSAGLRVASSTSAASISLSMPTSKSWSAGAGAGSSPICTRSTVAD
jgi:carbohydrate-selective porin OprB